LNVEPKLEPKAEPGERRILAEILIDDWISQVLSLHRIFL
jgi:hypothetical protein